MSIAQRFHLVWTPFLKRVNGRMHQAVGLVCPTVLGSGGSFTLEAAGRRETAHTLDLIRYVEESRDQNLPITYLWLIPQPKTTTRLRATWRTPLGCVYRASLDLKPAQPSTVHVVFKTHLDLGYTHRIAEVIRLYQTEFMEKLLDNLDRTADRAPGERFVWTLSTWLLERCLDPAGVKPDHLRRLEKYIRDGSVVWGQMPFTTHSEFFGLEELCRSLYPARRLAERFGRPVPTAAKMTDVPAHTAALGMAFASAGAKFLQIGTNPESISPNVPPLFWWKLPDENRILVYYRGTYGSPLLPPEDWPYREWLAVQITSDNVGPQSLYIADKIRWINETFDSPVCRSGQLEDFANAVIAHHGRELPEVEKEFTDWWIHGIASMADMTALAREDKERLPVAETLLTLAGLAAREPVSPAIVDKVREAYQQLTLYTEHTWGDHATDGRQLLPKGNQYMSDLFAGDNPKPPVDRWEASWEDKAEFARRARKLTDELHASAVERFSRVIQPASRASRTGGARTAAQGLRSVVLYNALSWKRGGVVRMSADDLPRGEFELVDPVTGGIVPYDRDGQEIVFVAPPVPACGYLALEVREGHRTRPGLPATWDDRNLTLHTDEYTLQFHTAGGLARWHDRARSSQWCSDAVEFPMGTYLYEMPGGEKIRRFSRYVHSNSYTGTPSYFHRPDYENLSQFGPVGGEKATITREITPMFARVVVEANCPMRKVPGRRSGDARRYRTTFTLYRGMRELHVRMQLVGKRRTWAAEAGYAFFPFSGEDPWILINRIAQQLDPAQDLPGSVNAAHFAVGRGMRIEHPHAGINFYPLHTPLISIGEPGAYAFRPDGRHENGIVYATLFNNCWGTNFAQWRGGDYQFDFVLRPTGNNEWDGGLETSGAEVFRPLVARVVHGRPVDPARSLLEIEPRDVQLVTLKPAEFERGTVLRLWNAAPKATQTRIRLPWVQRGQTLWLCDLLERRVRQIPVSRDGVATLKLRSDQIATVLWADAGR